ncbi:MAG: RNA-binding protein [Thermoprotei archaeon]|nr:MAG: RNA-binding protein [Thermoprotei archaeon]
MSYNLVVSTGRWREVQCINELQVAAKLIGEGTEVLSVRRTGFPGLLTALVSSDPKVFTRRLRELVLTSKFIPSFILKVIPIEVVVSTDFETIKRTAIELAIRGIPETATYKIEIRYRGVPINRMELINSIAKEIPRKVNLENPEKVLHLEIFPESTGISVLSPSEEVFSLMKVLREAKLLRG